jgi:hypothetical protein
MEDVKNSTPRRLHAITGVKRPGDLFSNWDFVSYAIQRLYQARNLAYPNMDTVSGLKISFTFYVGAEASDEYD